jgi:LacI family transcriptional regulator
MPPPKKPSLRHIAKIAGVSHMTVSLALRNSPDIAEKTRDRIRQIAEEEGYKPDPIVARVMSGIRYSSESGHVLAYVHNHSDENWRSHPYKSRAWIGAKQHAETLGYKLDDFKLGAGAYDSKQLTKVLRARGIQGLILAGMESRGHVSLDFKHFSSVALGTSIIRPQLHRIILHQMHTVQLALRKLRRLGNEKIGLVVPRWLDERNEHNWYAAFCVYQRGLSKSQIIPMLCPEKTDKKIFLHWLQKYQPDALILLDDYAPQWLREEGIRVPEDIQIAHLDLTPKYGNQLSGIDQRYALIGRAAVELLLGQMYFNEVGVPEAPRTTLIEGTWVDGASTKDRRLSNRPTRSPVMAGSATSFRPPS